jgi:hypothetical protein
VRKRNRRAIVDNEKLTAPSLFAHSNQQLAGPEIIAVLDRLDDALEGSCTETLGAALGPSPARLEQLGLLFDELGQPLHCRCRKLCRRELDQVVGLRPAVDHALRCLLTKPSLVRHNRFPRRHAKPTRVCRFRPGGEGLDSGRK